MTLILRKLLASSTYAISDTLDGLANRLQLVANAAEQVPAPHEGLADNFEELPEIEDEWLEDEDETETPSSAAQQLSPGQLGELKQEMAMLREFHALAKSIIKNSKGEVLLTALRRGFAAAEQAQKSNGVAALQQKALIFTESRRTQEYLYQILEKTEFAGKVVLFNGTNTDPKSRRSINVGWNATRVRITSRTLLLPTSGQHLSNISATKPPSCSPPRPRRRESISNSATSSPTMTCPGTRNALSSGLADAIGTARSSMWWL
jgi:hypothetical protein